MGRKKSKIVLEVFLFSIGLLFCMSEGISQSWKQYPYQPEGSAISFPVDEGRHREEPIEWWYIAGHLKGNVTGTPFSFMLTYFYYPAYGYDGFRILNLCNEESGEFFSETLPLHYTVMDTTSLDIQAVLMNDTIESWSTRKETEGSLVPFEYSISATGVNGSLELRCSSLKPPLILGDSGLFHQGAQSYTYYYSFTENEMDGVLTFNGEAEEVSGTAWIDRQYGNFNPITEEKYEWFYVQLSNGMDINIWNLFTPDNHIPELPEYKHISVYVDSSEQFTTYDFDFDRLAYVCMPDGEMCYSQKWHLSSEAEQLDLTLTTIHDHTEVQIPFRFYEGSLRVQGSVNGVPVEGIGFAELLKAYEPPQVVLTGPQGMYWNDTIPINWQLLDPDQGRSVQYNLEYVTVRNASFEEIEYGMADTFFLWQDPPLIDGDSIWFRLSSYSVDSTLLSSIQSTEALVYKSVSTYGKRDLYHDREDLTLLLYPNPTNEKLYLESVLDLSGNGYDIIDFTGRTVGNGILPFEIAGSGLDISYLSKGLYFLRIRHKERILTRSFMVVD